MASTPKGATTPPLPRRRRAYRTGMSADAIVTAALDLTREHGIDHWTMRDVAERLDTWPSVLYHHVGDRDALVWAVIERLAAGIERPDPDLPWQEWFRRFMAGWPQWLADYPGVAEFLVLRGPATPTAMSIVDDGMGTLLRAGFGDAAPLAYSMLLNVGAMYLATMDRRTASGRPDHQLLADAMAAVPDPGPGLRAMQEFVRTFDEDPDRARLAREEYYRVSIEVVIAGWEARLVTITAAPEQDGPASTAAWR